MMEMLNMENYR